jgi:hypothetical protein
VDTAAFRAALAAAADPWYAFLAGSPQDRALAAQVAAGAAPYRLATFAGYHAYQSDAVFLPLRP